MENLFDDNLVSYFSIRVSKRNHSGTVDVNHDKLTGRWFARLQYYNQMLILKSFADKESAVRYRKFAEQQIPALRCAWRDSTAKRHFHEIVKVPVG